MAGRFRPMVATVASALLCSAGLGVVADRAMAAAPAMVEDPTARADARPGRPGAYIVRLADPPLAGYAGGVAGIPATRPKSGDRLDLSTAGATKYRKYLQGSRQKVLDAVQGEKKLYDYDITFNGFAAELTNKQVAKLRATPGVVSVTRDTTLRLDTVSTPDFLGLTGSGGVWQKQFAGAERAGDGVIVGVVDSGLWPENPSFAALPKSDTDKVVAERFLGACDDGIEAETGFTCNNKVIGARYFVKGAGIDNIAKKDYISPRDYNGHGSHTASTIAGNHGVQAVDTATDQDGDRPDPGTPTGGKPLGVISGMAPAARIAVYKACWSSDEGDGCSQIDTVAAIDKAVADGVDVINYSISGSQGVHDAVEAAFYLAAKAGVFVAASAGNTGPTESSVNHTSPWITTVAAGTHDRSSTAKLTLGDGTTHNGLGLGAAVPSAPLVTAAAVAKAGAKDPQLCGPDTLDPSKVKGAIVVCDRGVVARVEKSLTVKTAGGVGMVLINTSPSSVNADLHYVPTVHLDEKAGAAVKTYAGKAGATAALDAGVQIKAPAPRVATFSARGPAFGGEGNILKPDILAPGVDVLAAVAPGANHGRLFDQYSGTSMASPHVAGLAAMVIAKHRSWSPMAVKSALMTTASTTDTEGKPITTDTGTPAGPLDYGAGHVAPAGAFDPGLVYNSSATDWDRYGCMYESDYSEEGKPLFTTPDGRPCTGLKPLKPSDLNYPTIAVGSLLGTTTVTRTVTNVGAKSATYTAAVEQPPGLKVEVKPAKLAVAAGRSATYTVTINRTTAAYGTYAGGSLTWSDGTHKVRSAIAVRPLPLDGPGEVGGTGSTGSKKMDLTSGFTGTLNTTVRGLVPSTLLQAPLSNSDEWFDDSAPKESAAVKKFTVTIPEGTRYARCGGYADDYTSGGGGREQSPDLQLHLYKAGTTTKVEESRSLYGHDDALINMFQPVAGQYDLYLQLISTPGTGAVSAKAHQFLLGDATVGNATADPAAQQVTVGQHASVTVQWKDLEPHRRWLGWFQYADGTTLAGHTVVTVVS